MKCFYHRNDLDGICSGAIVRRKYPDCKMIDFDYGETYPLKTINPKEMIILVDISLPPSEMSKFVEDEIKVIWIDHHHSAIHDSVLHGYDKIRGLRRVGVGACELAWKYFFESPVPESVRMLSQYDVWNHTNPIVVPFQYGIVSLGLSVYSSTWTRIFNDSFIDHTVRVGLKIIEYVKYSTRSIFRRTMYKDTWEGYTVAFINSCILDSILYTLLPQADLFGSDIIVSYYRSSDKRYRVSLRAYKEGVDVSEIARKHGGGGHKSAAGFICDELPFTIKRG